jgi:uncharacterized protein (TIGR03435 family)
MRRVSAVLAALGLTIAPQAPANQPIRLEFEVASVKPSPQGAGGARISALPGGQTFVVRNVPVKIIFMFAHELPPRQVSGGPDWLDTENYDIDAKAALPSSRADLLVMFQNLLADRFKLQFHRETKDVPVYALTVDRAGSKMKLNESEDDFKIPIGTRGRGRANGTRVPMSYLCFYLSRQLDRNVIDKTGLDKFYDFTLEWTPEPQRAADPVGRTIFTAVREQLGLKLESQKGPVEFYIIDHAEKPSVN